MYAGRQQQKELEREAVSDRQQTVSVRLGYLHLPTVCHYAYLPVLLAACLTARKILIGQLLEPIIGLFVYVKYSFVYCLNCCCVAYYMTWLCLIYYSQDCEHVIKLAGWWLQSDCHHLVPLRPDNDALHSCHFLFLVPTEPQKIRCKCCIVWFWLTILHSYALYINQVNANLGFSSFFPFFSFISTITWALVSLLQHSNNSDQSGVSIVVISSYQPSRFPHRSNYRLPGPVREGAPGAGILIGQCEVAEAAVVSIGQMDVRLQSPHLLIL